MPTDIWKIPLDNDGAVRGSYYLRHRNEVSDTLGVIHFERGRSVEPVTGPRLMHFVSALGADVDLEPADDEARAAMGVAALEPTPAPATPEAAQAAADAALKRAGASLARQVDEGLDGTTIGELAAAAATDPAPPSEPEIPLAKPVADHRGKHGKR